MDKKGIVEMGKTVECKACGGTVSKNAKACPKCGEPAPKQTSIVTWLVLILIIVGVWGSIKSGDYERASQQAAAAHAAKESPEAKTTRLLNELKGIPAKDYEENRVRYAELATLHPQNETYKSKLKHYSEKAARIKLIEKQFSAWDGSHNQFEEYIKGSMNDPDSYEHDETRYIDKGDHLVVITSFRGKNAFGGTVKNSMAARVALDGTVIEILNL
jgi:RNA polymerase subunit RPABC4/transcription elongation factor Spt4